MRDPMMINRGSIVQQISDLERDLDQMLKVSGSLPHTRKSQSRHLQLSTMKDNIARLRMRADALARQVNSTGENKETHVSAVRRNKSIPPSQANERSKSTLTRSTYKSQPKSKSEHGTKQQNLYLRHSSKENTTNASGLRTTDLQRKSVLESQPSTHSKTRSTHLLNKSEQNDTSTCRSGATKWTCKYCPTTFHSYEVAKTHQELCKAGLKRSTYKASQPIEQDRSTNKMTKDASRKPTKDKDNKEAAVILCGECDKKIKGDVRTKYTSVEGVGYKCSKCGDPTVYCEECAFDWGSFCAGEMCNKFYCGACRPDYLGEEGEDQYCGRTCMGKYHPDYEKYSRHRVPYSDGDREQEVDKIASILGYRQCKGITQKGYRCKVKSTHDYWSAASLQSGDDYCLHHGGRSRDSAYDNCDYSSEEEAWDCYSLDEGWDCT
eukprot:scaffold35788_cov183-Skeletonema_marinoi.AAC.3